MKPPSTICPKCGLAVPEGIATCPEDGHPLAEALRPFGEEARPARDDAPALGGDDPLGPTRKRAAVPERPPSLTLRRDPLIGQTLGEYVVEELIGVGGMGLVYRGLQPMIGKPVAIKILRPEISDSPSHVERLLAEARAVNAVRHRGIIDIFNFGRLADGRQYLVMEFLQGKALDEYIAERGALVPSEAVTLLQEIASALAAAHEAGVVHRDLKPNNIFLVKQSGGQYVKLLDFGLAKQTSPHGTTPQTHAGLVVGTPEYMAPEQARGEAIGPKTDLYALGVVAFQMLTGQLPFEANSPMEFLVRHLEYTPPKVIELMPDVPEELSDLVDQLLLKAPEDRPTSADQVRRELRQIARLIPQDVTFVGPPQPEKKSSNVIISPSLSNGEKARSGEKPRAPRVPTPTRHTSPRGASTTETTPAVVPAPSSQRKLAVGAAAAVALLIAGAAVTALTRSPAPAAPLAEAPRATLPPPEAVVPAVAVAPPPSPPAEPPPPPVKPVVKPVTEPVVKPVEEPVEEPVVTRPPPTPPRPKPPPPPRVSPLEQAISRRITDLSLALGTRARHPELERSARSILDNARGELRNARTDEKRQEVARALDVWERRFLLPAR